MRLVFRPLPRPTNCSDKRPNANAILGVPRNPVRKWVVAAVVDSTEVANLEVEHPEDANLVDANPAVFELAGSPAIAPDGHLSQAGYPVDFQVLYRADCRGGHPGQHLADRPVQYRDGYLVGLPGLYLDDLLDQYRVDYQGDRRHRVDFQVPSPGDLLAMGMGAYWAHHPHRADPQVVVRGGCWVALHRQVARSQAMDVSKVGLEENHRLLRHLVAPVAFAVCPSPESRSTGLTRGVEILPRASHHWEARHLACQLTETKVARSRAMKAACPVRSVDSETTVEWMGRSVDLETTVSLWETSVDSESTAALLVDCKKASTGASSAG